MADTRLRDLSTKTDPAASDFLYIVDSASGEGKLALGDILGILGAATQSKSGDYTVGASDHGELHLNTAALTATLLAAATAGDGFNIAFYNNSTAVLTLDGNGSETIDGRITMTVRPNECVILLCNGSNWFSIGAANRALALLEEQTASASTTIDFTSFLDSTYEAYLFRFINLVPSTMGGENFEARISIASSFQTASYQYHVAGTDSSSSSYAASSSTSAAFLRLASGPVGGDTGESFSGSLLLHNPSETSLYKLVEGCALSINAAGNPEEARMIGAYTGSTGAVDGMRFGFGIVAGSVTISSGTLRLYGVA